MIEAVTVAGEGGLLGLALVILIVLAIVYLIRRV